GFPNCSDSPSLQLPPNPGGACAEESFSSAASLLRAILSLCSGERAAGVGSTAEDFSFFCTIEAFSTKHTAGEEATVQVFGKVHSIPRKQATYGDAGLTYTYSGVTRLACPWTPTLEYIRDVVTKTTGHTFNFVLVNRYKDGQDHMGEHRDDEKELDPLCPIASVSLGAARDFIFRHRDARGKHSCRQINPVKLQLAHGSLLLMNSPTNTFWYHSLPVRKKMSMPRINLTFRRIMDRKK
uniref:DNA oxidative demethylase ALKBH2 n=1 Tax=Cyclopterus lumpus TaxID=8103 RepID=A0A8C2WVN4_CYCLU